jgi:Flp pilus assembly protein TadD
MLSDRLRKETSPLLHPSNPPRILPGLFALSALFLLSACAGTTRDPILSRDLALKQQVRQKGFDPQELTFPFELSEEMRQWVHAEIPRGPQVRSRLRALLDALLDEKDLGGLGIQYEAGFTPTATEMYQSRTANCLGFTHAFVGLAREIGIDAYYLDVLNFQTFARAEDLIIESGHITAGHGVPTNRMVLEYSVGPDADYTYVRRVEDLEALALYYSNRGAELLQEGRLPEAVTALRIAVTLDPDLPDAWVNYGVALRRQGEHPAAEEAYRRALEVDSKMLSAYTNLATLLRLQGRRSEADDLALAARRLGDDNPYNYLALGDIALRRGRVREAERFYRQALKLEEERAEPYAALGLLAFEMARDREAQDWLEKARSRNPRSPRVLALARRLNRADDEGMARLIEVKGKRKESRD